MDLYKVFDQTVREIKREVNKKVLKVPEIEQKVLEATSNEPWGPHGTLMSDIAMATRNYHEYQMIMAILWKRLNDTGKNWRHVYKALTVLEFLVIQGAERTIDEVREKSYQIQTLVDFQFVEPNGKDQGINVRKKAQTLVALVNDKEKIREARNKAQANKDKYKGMSSTGGQKSSYGGSDRGDRYGDRERDDDRYSERDGERYGSRGGRDGEKYGSRSEERYSGKDDREGDRYSKDRDRYEDDRDYDDDREYDPRRADKAKSSRPPPSYDDYGSPTDEDPRERGVAAAIGRAKAGQKAGGSQTGSGKAGYFPSSQAADDDFDDFDPRGRSTVAAPAMPAQGAVHPEDDFFSQTAPVVSAAKPAGGVEDLFGDAAFQAAPSAPQPQQQQQQNLFAQGAFQSAPSSSGGLPPPPSYTSVVNAPPPPTSFGQFESAPPPAAPPTSNPASSGFGFDAFGGDSFSAFESAKPAAAPAPAPASAPGFLAAPPSATGFSSFQSAPPPMSSGPASVGGGAPTSSLTAQGKSSTFQPKSALFADTLSTGLVDLNIQGPRDNPLASLGIDLSESSLVRATQAKNDPSPPSSISMGKAMGGGTGMGLAGAGMMAPPPPPMVQGIGMGMGGGMGMGMGPMNPSMGMGPMNPGMGMGGMGMGMGMNPAMGANAGMGMQGGMMGGMGGPRPMGMGGYPQGQQFGGGFM